MCQCSEISKSLREGRGYKTIVSYKAKYTRVGIISKLDPFFFRNWILSREPAPEPFACPASLDSLSAHIGRGNLKPLLLIILEGPPDPWAIGERLMKGILL